MRFDPLTPDQLATATSSLVDRYVAGEQRAGTRLPEEAAGQRTALREQWAEGLPPTTWVGRAPHGSLLWLSVTGQVAHVVACDLATADLTREGVVRDATEALVDAVRSTGATDVMWTHPQSGDADALLAGAATGEPALVATSMALDLHDPTAREAGGRAGEQPADGAPTVRLRPMTEVEFEAYRTDAVNAYAAERLQAGADPDAESASRTAWAQFAQMLPQGLQTPGAHLLAAEHDGRPVGILWLTVTGGRAFIADIEVLEAHRGKGLGTAVLDAAVTTAGARGARQIALNVFGHNDDARRLYERAGYRVTSQTLRAAL